MATIRDLSTQAFNLPVRQPGNVWRDELLPANFDGFPFHVDQYGTEGGSRIVTHQFPKKDLPYSENMGRRAREFTVRGYIIVYPTAGPSTEARQQNGIETLYQRDYRNARDQLRERLDKGTPGVLQLPTFKRDPMVVVCPRYRLSEEEKAGGYCVFDMQFVEFGARPFTPKADSMDQLYQKSYALRQQIQSTWDREIASSGAVLLGPIKTGTTSPASEFTKRSTGRASALMGPFNPLKRFIGAPNKMGPVRTGKTSPQSEFTTKSQGKASSPMKKFRASIQSSPQIPGF